MPKKRNADEIEEDETKEELQPIITKEEQYEQHGAASYARKMADENREELKRQQFIQQYVAPLRETEKYNSSQNARMFAAKWDAKMAGAAIPMKHRTDIFMMLLRQVEALKMKEKIDDAVIDLIDWPTVKQTFEKIFKPTLNNAVCDATELLNMRQQPAEDVSNFALRWRESMLLSPLAGTMELSALTEQNKWQFVAGLKPALREALRQQLDMMATILENCEGPAWYKLVTMAQKIEAATTLPAEMARVRIEKQKKQWKGNQQKQEKQQTEGTCWRCGGPHMRSICKFPPSICCTACGRKGHMRKVCRQKKMTKSKRPSYKQQWKPTKAGAAAMVAGMTSTEEEEEEEASWNAALKVGLHLVDAMKPTTALLIATLVMMCTPAMAATTVQLNETTVFPKGLALCEPPMGGGHLMALPLLPNCHKAMAPPIDKINARLFVRQHKSQQGEIFAIQSIKTTRCTHLGWFFSVTFFPDQIEQEALQHNEIEMIEDAITAMKGNLTQRPSEFYSGEQQFHREADMNVWMTKNEIQYATSYLRFKTCVATFNYIFVIGQYTLYDTLKMTSDIADLDGVNYEGGRATTERFTLRWNVEELKNVSKSIQCSYTQLRNGTATLQGHRLIIENPKMAFELTTKPIREPCVSEKPLWPSTVCCYLVEFTLEQNMTKSKEATPKLTNERIKKDVKMPRWWTNLHQGVLDEIDVVSEYLLSRQDREEFKLRAAEKLAECETQRMMQQMVMELLPMDPTLAVRLLTGDDTLAVSHVGSKTVQVYKCRNVKKFEVKWSGKDGEGKCYNMVPVVLPGGRQYYLKPGMNELIPNARQVNCADRPKFVFQTAPHTFMTTEAQQVVHSIPSMFHYEYNDDEKATKLNTDHFYTAQRITGLMMEDSIQSQAQRLYEQEKMQQQVKRLIRAVDNYKVDEQAPGNKDKTEAQSGGWLSWISKQLTKGAKYIFEEVIKEPARLAIKIAAIVVALLVIALLIKCGLSYSCRSCKKWKKKRARKRQMATVTVNERRRGCRNCGAQDHTTANCIQGTRGEISMVTRSRALTNTSMAVIMAIGMLDCAECAKHAAIWPISTPFTAFKAESPTIQITVKPRRGQAVNTEAIIDTGASVSVCSKSLASKFGWLKEGIATEARQPLSLIGVGQKEAEHFVEGTLQIGNTVLPTVRLWIAPIGLKKMLLGNDVLTRVAKIELEYGNLRRFQVATAVDETTKIKPKTKPDLMKKAVEHLTKLRTMDFGDTTLNTETQDKIRNLMMKWAQIFPRDDMDIGYNDSMPMDIDTGDAKPIAQAVRRVPYALREPLEKKLQTWIDMGILVHDDTCEWASPVFALPKKEPGEVNLICDYRKLNAVTKLGTQIIDNMQEMLDTAATWKYIVTLDMRQSYAQCALSKEAQKKAAIATTLGVLRPTRVQFGLKGAPAHFTRLVRSILRDIPNVQTYIDDCVYGANTQDELLEITDKVFERFAKANLRLNPKKNQFGRKTTVILGHEITSEGLKPQQTKLDIIKHWPIPKDANQLRQFLGLANFFRKFVAGYATKVAILEKLVRDTIHEKKKYEWTTDHQAAFDQLKDALHNAPCLTHPSKREADTYYIFVDASNWAIGAVLTLFKEEVQAYQPVGAFSKRFTATEQRYSTIERELLGVLRALQHWAIYIWGHSIVVFTDHKPIAALMRSKGGASGPVGITNRLETFLQRVAPFNVEVRYIEGLKNTAADALSRIPKGAVIETKDEGEEENIVLPVTTRSQKQLQTTWAEKVQQELLREQEADPEIEEIANYLKKRPKMTKAEKAPYTKWDAEFDKINGIVVWTKKEKAMPYIPKTMRTKILKALHATPLAGHKGGQKLYAELAKVAYWPGMYKNVHKYAAECISCQRFKIDRTGLKGIDGEYPVPPFCFHTVHADFTGTIHGADGPNVIMTFIDALSRFFIAVPTENSTAETAARVFVNEIICRFGAPVILITDNGTAFTAELFEHVCKILEIAHLTTAPYAPQSNGSIERAHQTMKMKLRQAVSRGGADWRDKLPMVVAAMNFSPQLSGLSAVEIIYGRPPIIPTDWTPILKAQIPPPLNLKEFFEELQDERMAKMIQQASYREEDIHKRRNKQTKLVRKPLKVGDLVLYRDLKVRRTKNMHSPVYAGPAEIKEINGATALLEPLPTGVHYTLRQKRTDRKNFRIHLGYLRKYAGDPNRDHRLAADYPIVQAMANKAQIKKMCKGDANQELIDELLYTPTAEALQLFRLLETLDYGDK